MGLIDIVLLVVIAAFVFFGFFFGLIHTIGSLVGTIFGVMAATLLSDTIFEMFGFFLGGGSFARVFIFIILFLIVHRLFGLVLWVFQKVFGFFSVIPFATLINRLFGAGLGLVEGVIVVAVLVFYAMRVLPGTAVVAALDTSLVASILVSIIEVFQGVIPGLV
jgi:uncharacterized membrane protein required for colicin V production